MIYDMFGYWDVKGNNSVAVGRISLYFFFFTAGYQGLDSEP